MTGIRTCAVCAALLLAGFACGASPAEPPNIVLIIVDDVGVELFGAYNRDRLEVKGASIPPEHRVMPNIDALAERGLLFRNAWSAPLCGLVGGAIPFHDACFLQGPALPRSGRRDQCAAS
jgi:hypothetical protein